MMLVQFQKEIKRGLGSNEKVALRERSEKGSTARDTVGPRGMVDIKRMMKRNPTDDRFGHLKSCKVKWKPKFILQYVSITLFAKFSHNGHSKLAMFLNLCT